MLDNAPEQTAAIGAYTANISPAESETLPIDKAAIKRMSFPVDDNGNINWEGMRPGTAAELRETLKRAYSDASLMGELGAAPLPIVEIFDADWTGSLFDGLGIIESMLAQRMYGLPSDVASQVFTYSELEKKKLGPLAAKVINKYASKYDVLVAFKEEIAFGILFFAITSMKFRMASVQAGIFKAKQRVNGAERPPATIIEETQEVPVQ